MMTIWDSTCRKELLARFESLTPDRRPVWGSMTCAQMITHVADPLKAAMGEKAVAPKPGPFRNPVLRYMIIYWLPWPKGAPTAPEFIHTDEPDFKEGLATLRATVEQFAAADKGARREPHPAFGVLSHKAWGRLTYRHLEHHLRQFGA
jgi:hypothetical protein